MKISDTIRRAGRSLRQAKARTLLTSLAISVGAFTVTVALAAGAGSQAYSDTLIKNNGDAKSLSVFAKIDQQDDSPKEYNEGNMPPAQQGQLTDRDVDKIEKVTGVAEVVPEYLINASYMTRGEGYKRYETTLAVKVDRTSIPLAAGSLENNQVPIGGVIVPEVYLEPLGFASASEAIGQTIILRIERSALPSTMGDEFQDKVLHVVAIDKKSSTVLRYETALRLSTVDGRAIHDYQSAGQALGDRYYGVNVRVADNASVSDTQKAIESEGYTVFSLQDIQETLFQFISIVQWGAAGFGFLAILASVFGIINTQYISVLERTQQIGLMKALGAKRRDVGRLFRYEAAWVGFLGGMIGTILAWLTGLFNPFIASSLNLEKGTVLLRFDLVSSSILILSLMLVAVAAGYFPARRAARLDPIEALRTE